MVRGSLLKVGCGWLDGARLLAWSAGRGWPTSLRDGQDTADTSMAQATHIMT